METLDSMCKESLKNKPNDAIEAVEEYVERLNSEDSAELKAKFENEDYYKRFQMALLHTLNIVFSAAYKATDSDQSIDFNKYIEEYLMLAKQDDKFITTMKLSYLSKINAKKMGIDELYSDEFNNLMSKLIEQYKSSI